MKTTWVALMLLFLSLTTFALQPLAQGKSDDDKEEKPDTSKLPNYLWYTDVLKESFTIDGTKYDADKGLVTWTLKAKDDIQVNGFDALLEDACGVTWAELEIQLKPAQKEYEKDEIVEAVLQLPEKEKLQEVNKITIRKLKKS